MADENSNSLGSFWHRSVDKISPKKLKFMPNVTNPGQGKAEDPKASGSAAVAKAHRRAQVRKAQLEHRQRKKNYAKHLEEDVIRLREMIAAVETEAAVFRHENLAIRQTLTSARIPISLSTSSKAPIRKPDPLMFQDQQQQSQNLLPGNISNFQPFLQHLQQWPTISSTTSSATVNVTFDEMLNTTCLQISPNSSLSYGTDFSISPPGHFDLPIQSNMSDFAFTDAPSTSINQNFMKPLPSIPPGASPPPSTSTPGLPDITTIAINFILALEHPCRTHFHAPIPASQFNPTGAPSGHELLCSTLLYTSAPSPIFDNLTTNTITSNASPSTSTTSTWTTPLPSLSALLALSHSLPKDDWEITPVQAWFLLTERYDVRELVLGEKAGRRLEFLRRGLGALVGCFAFGAVLDRERFWECVGRVMEEEEIL